MAFDVHKFRDRKVCYMSLHVVKCRSMQCDIQQYIVW